MKSLQEALSLKKTKAFPQEPLEMSTPAPTQGVFKKLNRESIASEYARDKIEKAGLLLPKRPQAESCPELPYDVTRLSDTELGYYLGIFASWIAYAEYTAAISDIRSSSQANLLDFVSSKVQLEKQGTVQQKSDQRMVDGRYQAALQDSENAQATKLLTGSLLRGYVRQYEALSRELTRRQNDIDRKTRG